MRFPSSRGATWLHGVGWFASGAAISAGILGFWQGALSLVHLLLLAVASFLAGVLASRGARVEAEPDPASRASRGTASGEDPRASEDEECGLSQAREHVTDATDLFRGSVQRATQEMVILDMAAHGVVVELERSRGALDRVRRERTRFTRSFEAFVQDFSKRAEAQEEELEDALRFGLEVDVAARMVARIAKETAMICIGWKCAGKNFRSLCKIWVFLNDAIF